ncbi:MAG: SPFH/Band 7/PHB domain protein [Streptosporangiales bacterium]|nr:SPFH/Band 7/PHB domain protein [Streptosporangiales bacterium]
MTAGLIAAIVIALAVVILLARTIRIVPQQRAAVVERLGKYNRTLEAGPRLLIPFFERIRHLADLREQVVPFPPQPVITQDSLSVNVDTVVYYTVTNARDATYEIANFIQGIEQLTITTLRNVIGSMDLERTLTSREEINNALRGVLDDATGRWGVRVNRVELRAIDPPPTIKDAMEKAMRADRDKRAAILNAEGVKQSQILTAEGDQQSAILRARGEAEAAVTRAEGDARAQALRASGEAQAIETVFEAIHEGDADQKLLSYQYLQMLPKIAEGDSNKLWIVPSELGKALEGLGGVLGSVKAGAEDAAGGETEASEADEAAAADGGGRRRKRSSSASLTQAIEQLGATPVGPVAGETTYGEESEQSQPSPPAPPVPPVPPPPTPGTAGSLAPWNQPPPGPGQTNRPE